MDTKTKWADFIDNYAVRFYQELNYLLEAENSLNFKR